MTSLQQFHASEQLEDLGARKYLSLHNFLTSAGIDTYKLEALPSDCSPRRYYRVFTIHGTYVLMDSSNDVSYDAFLHVGQIVRTSGVRCPKVLHSNAQLRYLLLEDFGDSLLTKYLATDLREEKTLYQLCIEELVKLARISVADVQLPVYTSQLLDKEVSVFCEWFMKPRLNGDIYKEAESRLRELLHDLYQLILKVPQVVTLRDVMADNLFVLPSTGDTGRIGFIDYQDAVIGSCAYDVVSLLEDARRDVSADVVTESKSIYCERLGIDKKDFNVAYTVLGLQRNLKIVGIFHRRHLRDGQERYLSYLPRVWQFIEVALQQDEAQPIAGWFNTYFPTR